MEPDKTHLSSDRILGQQSASVNQTISISLEEKSRPFTGSWGSIVSCQALNEMLQWIIRARSDSLQLQ